MNEEFFIIEYPNAGLTTFETFEDESSAKERVLELFESGKEYGVKLHHCVIKMTYDTEMAIKYIPQLGIKDGQD